MGTNVQPVTGLLYNGVTPAQYAESEVSALAHRHVTLTYSILGVLVLTLALAAFGGWLSIRGYERALQRAEAAEAVSKQREDAFNVQFKAFQDQIAKDAADRAQAQAQQDALIAKITTRDKQPVPVVIQTGLKADATAEDAKNALGAVFSTPVAPVAPTVTSDGKVAVTVKEAQEITSAGFDGQRAEADLRDTVSLYTLEKTKTTSLSNDLNQCQAGLTEAKATVKAQDTTIADFKKAAKRSRFQKFLSGAEKALLLVGGIYIGHKL